MRQTAIENELDVQLCFSRLWRRKLWILGFTLLGVVLAWSYAQLAPQKWVATAEIDRPNISDFSHYYQRNQQLASISADTLSPPSDINAENSASAVAEQLYAQFTRQLRSTDNRRAFWEMIIKNAPQLADGKANNALEMSKRLARIRFRAGDKLKESDDTLSLQADSATKSSQLLARYIDFTNQSVITLFNRDLAVSWQIEALNLQQKIDLEQGVAKAAYETHTRQLQAEVATTGSSEAKAKLNQLQAVGPQTSDSLLQAQARLRRLQNLPLETIPFKSWSYLQSPYPPTTRDSPRTLLLCIMWGVVGALIGAGLALFRAEKKRKHEE